MSKIRCVGCDERTIGVCPVVGCDTTVCGDCVEANFGCCGACDDTTGCEQCEADADDSGGDPLLEDATDDDDDDDGED